MDKVATTDRGDVDIDSSYDIAYIWLNPKPEVTSLNITLGGNVDINQVRDETIDQLDYTYTIDIL